VADIFCKYLSLLSGDKNQSNIYIKEKKNSILKTKSNNLLLVDLGLKMSLLVK